MGKIYFQGTFGAYSHLAAVSIDPDAEILPCKTFDDCFNKASEEPDCRIIIPESNSCLLYTSPSPRDVEESRMPSSA